MTPHRLTTRFTPLPMILLALFALILQGCGDGPSDADPTGYYTDSGFVDVMMDDDTTPRGAITDLQGMVTNGQLMMLSDKENLTYVGTFTVSGNDFSGSVTVYEKGVMKQEDVPLSGVITATSSITGTLGGVGVANGTFRLDYAADNGPVDLGMVVQDIAWRSVANPNIPALNLKNATEAAPAVNFSSGGTGSNILEGCSYSDRMEPIAGTHLYTVSVTMDGCDGAGTGVDEIPAYTGLASLRGTNRFILVLTNGLYDFSGEYFKCLGVGCTPQ